MSEKLLPLSGRYCQKRVLPDVVGNSVSVSISDARHGQLGRRLTPYYYFVIHHYITLASSNGIKREERAVW